MFLRPWRIIKNSKFLTKKYSQEPWDIKHLGNPIINDLKVITSKQNENIKFVIKKYGSIFSLIKWTLIKFMTFYVSNYTVNSKNRALNEINGLFWCGMNGIKSPKFHEQVGTAIIIDFIKGTPTDQYTEFTPEKFFEHFTVIGKLIAKFHLNGAVIGDCKAENIFYFENQYYFLDLEQFTLTKQEEIKKRIWDITEFFFYLGHFYPFKERYPFLRKIIINFLTSYFSTIIKSDLNSDIKQNLVTEFGKFKYYLIYLTFMNPLTFKFIFNTIKEFKSTFFFNKS